MRVFLWVLVGVFSISYGIRRIYVTTTPDDDPDDTLALASGALWIVIGLAEFGMAAWNYLRLWERR